MSHQNEDFMDEIFKTVQLPDVKYTDPEYKPNVRIIKQSETQVTKVTGQQEHQVNGFNHQTLEYTSNELQLNGVHDSVIDENENIDYAESTFNEENESHHNGFHHYEEPADQANLDETGWKSVVHNEVFIEGSEFAENNSEFTKPSFAETHTISEDIHEDAPIQLHYDSMNNYVEENNFHLEKPETPTYDKHTYDEVESTNESPTLPRKTESRDRLIEEFKKHHSGPDLEDSGSNADTIDHGHLNFEDDHYHNHKTTRELESDEETEEGIVTMRKVEYHFDSGAVNQIKEKTFDSQHHEPKHQDTHHYNTIYDEVSNIEETPEDVYDKESTYSDFERYVGIEYEAPEKHSPHKETPAFGTKSRTTTTSSVHTHDYKKSYEPVIDIKSRSTTTSSVKTNEHKDPYEFKNEIRSRSSSESTLTPHVEQKTHIREIEVRTPLHAYPQGAYSTYEGDQGKQILDEVKEAPGVRNLKSMFEDSQHTGATQPQREHYHTLEKQDEAYRYPFAHYAEEMEGYHYYDYQQDQENRTRTQSQTSERESVDLMPKHTETVTYQPYHEPTQNQIAHAVSKKGEAEVVYEDQLSVQELRAKFGISDWMPKVHKQSLHEHEEIEAKSRTTTTSTVNKSEYEPLQTKSRTSTASTIYSNAHKNPSGRTYLYAYKEPSIKSRTSTISTIHTHEFKEPLQVKSRTSTNSTIHTHEFKEPIQVKSRTSTNSTIHTHDFKEPIQAKSRTSTNSTIHTHEFKEPIQVKSRTSTNSTIHTNEYKEPIVAKSRTSTTSTLRTLEPEKTFYKEVEAEIKPQPKLRQGSINSDLAYKNDEKEPPIGSLAALQKSLKTYAPKEIHISPQIAPTSPTSPTSPLDKFHSVRVVKNVREFVKVWGHQPMEIPYEKRGRAHHMAKAHEMDEMPTKIDRATSYHTIDLEVQKETDHFSHGNVSKRSSIASNYSRMSKKQLPTHFEIKEEFEYEPEVKLESAEAPNLLISYKFNDSPEKHTVRESVPEIDDEELSKLSVRDRMKFFQEGHAKKHSHNEESYETEQVIEHEFQHHHETLSDDGHLDEGHNYPKNRVKRNISLLIQELTNRNN